MSDVDLFVRILYCTNANAVQRDERRFYLGAVYEQVVALEFMPIAARYIIAKQQLGCIQKGCAEEK